MEVICANGCYVYWVEIAVRLPVRFKENGNEIASREIRFSFVFTTLANEYQVEIKLNTF